jgi:adenine-specific DNA-methyltransferase
LYEKKGYDRGVTLYNNLDSNYKIWGKINVSWPNATTLGPRYDVPHPITGKPVAVPDRGWRWKKETFDSLVDYNKTVKRHDGTYMCGQIWFDSKESTQPSLIKHLDDVENLLLRSVLSLKSDGGIEVEELFGEKNVLSYPKPKSLLRTIIGSFELIDGDVILDFFAGSATTAHATLELNAEDNMKRHCILVQLPEPLDPENKDQKVAADFCDKLGKPRTIAELTKERLRRAAKKIKDENPLFAGDLGFRVFKLDSSNIRAWEPDRSNLEQTLLDHAEHLKEGRTELDILFELLLKLGLDLCVPIEAKTIVGKAVQSIGGGVLLACLATQITRDEVEPLAQGIVNWYKALAPAGDTTVVFRDSAFADDVAKTNLSAILNQHGLTNVRSL